MGSGLRDAKPASGGDLPETRIGAPKAPARRPGEEPDPCPPGTMVGEKYQVTARMGRGGMGIVVAAKHVELGHSVAIKIMQVDDVDDTVSVRRFVREGRAAAALKSDHAVRIYDVGRLASGVPYLVMEHLEGTDLSALVKKKGRLPIDQAVDYVVQAAFALSEAHASGLIHRDLKPQNLFLARTADGRKRIKVLDFGLVKETSEEGLTSTTAPTPNTTDGVILGSPYFMSPEQIRDPRGVDRRTDIWSLGATLFQLVTGKPPFDATTLPTLLAKILSESAPDVRTEREDVPEGIARVIARCLSRDPNDRFATVADFIRALNACGATSASPLGPIGTPVTEITPARGASKEVVRAVDDMTRTKAIATPRPTPASAPPPQMQVTTQAFGPPAIDTPRKAASEGPLSPKTLAMPMSPSVPRPGRVPTFDSTPRPLPSSVAPPAAEAAPLPSSLRGSRVPFVIIVALLAVAIVAAIGAVVMRRSEMRPAAGGRSTVETK